MTPATSWLIDKSAYVRLGASPRAGEWAERIDGSASASQATTRSSKWAPRGQVTTDLDAIG